ncbi:MAG: hypothetical protein H6595_10140 [Flavobacteriales bacterium]|nr:hypothetical protein [Flavobacteriales bacterium]MCB9167821.1 hypothetical protein [Flavobacteriales bacterium]
MHFRLLLLPCFALLANGPLQAQLFNGMNYQAVLRDAQGDPMTNQAVTLTFNVRQGSAVGPIVFTDTHATSTNDRGLVNVVIGKGTVAGSLVGLDYAGTDYYLVVYVNGAGLPAQRLEAVPMSYKATHMQLSDLTDVGNTAPALGQVLQYNGLEWVPGTVAGGGGGLWSANGSDIYYAAGDVGIGTVSPQYGLQVHQPASSTPSVFQLSTVGSGNTSSDGLQLRVEGNGEAQLRQRENAALSLWTNDIERMHINNAGKIGINRQGVLGSSDLTIRSLNSTGYCGMYVESPSATNGQPFYGYASDGLTRAWHYFDEVSDQWRLYVDGTQLLVVEGDDQNVGINTLSPDPSAVLDVYSTNKGFLLPRMTTAQRTAISTPADGLLVYDTNLAKTMQYSGGAWQQLGAGAGSSQWVDDAYGISYSADGVGIGTGSSPLASLNLNNGGAPIALASTTNYSGGLATYGLQSTVGSTGTGTRYALHGVANAPSGGTASAYGVYGTAGATSASDVYGVYGLASATNGGNGYGVYGRANGANTGVFGYAPDANGIAIHGVADQTSGSAAQFDGDVRVNGTASQLYLGDHCTLYTYSSNGAPRMYMSNAAGTGTVDLTAQYTASGGARMLLKDDGGTTRITMLVQTNDRGRVITDELEIKGGADLAEHFEVIDAEGLVEPGMLVSIAEDGSGRLVPSTRPYDHRVAGVVSGANGVMPGLTLRQEGTTADGEVPVALNGRVYVWADATYGPIAPGDLLTSSDRAGHAMKASDPERTSGTVIGKAMTTLDSGTGLVLVLVNLQ